VRSRGIPPGRRQRPRLGRAAADGRGTSRTNRAVVGGHGAKVRPLASLRSAAALSTVAGPECAAAPAGQSAAPAARVLCGVSRVGGWANRLPGRLWHLALTDWPWLLAAAAAAAVLVAAGRIAYRAAWRRAVAGGYWVQVTRPAW
jgi:hypothetical protein